jgi:signal transduction histidine kinase
VAVQLHDRSGAPWQLAAGVVLAVLLATLATLQYRWLGSVSDAERARMRDSLRTRATDFSQEFDRELTRIYLAFHFANGRFDENPDATTADAWTKAQNSSDGTQGLIKEVFIFDPQQPAVSQLRRLDPQSRTLRAAQWPAELERWRTRSGLVVPGSNGMVSPLFLTDAVDAETPGLIVPLPQLTRLDEGGHFAVVPEPNAIARAVLVWLDKDRLQQLLQPLVTKYFGAGDASEYLVSIVQRDDPARVVFASSNGATVDERSADVTTGMFDLRMDEVARITGALVPRRLAIGGGDRMAITIVRRANGPAGARVLMSGGENQGAWQVRARYRGGSLDALVAQSRRRNLAISLGVLGLLAASFVLVIAAAQRQQRLARQQMEFVAAVSHELRTPLAVICSAGENLADGVVSDGDQVKRYGSLIGTEGRRLGDMVERVLQFAGIGSGTTTHARADVDVTQVIADAVDSMSADARDRGVSITVHPNGTLPTVAGDANALRSAIQNVVGNAVKYSASGGSVDVTTDVVNGAIVRVRVADHGIGIDGSDLPHIFKPFYRGRRAVDAQVRGTGVGLSVVLHVMHVHGGDVRVDSSPGEGTTVTLVLPAGSAAEAADGHGRVARLRGDGVDVTS